MQPSKKKQESHHLVEQRNVSQICEMLLHEGIGAYKKEGSKFMQRLVAKQKLRAK